MGIKKDAGEIVLFFYKRKVNGEKTPGLQEIIDETGWEGHRLENALSYCEDNGFIASSKTMGNINGVQTRVIKGLTSSGIDIVENTETEEGKREFNVNFNLTFNNEFNIDSIIKGEAKLFG